MNRIDFHTHILPGVDDGAGSNEIALHMLRMMQQSHVDLVIATPHYFSLDESPGDFLQRVGNVYARFKSHATCRFLLGAEVYLDRGLLLKEDLGRLCIEGTDLLLLEIPVSEYRDWMYQTIAGIASVYGVRPVIAHVERVLPRIRKKDLERLMEIPGICFQFNHTAFGNWKARWFLKTLVKRGYPVFFGSDCHDIHSRPPTDEKGFDKIETWISKKFGNEFMDKILWVQQNELNLL